MSLYESVSTKRGSDAISGERPAKLTKKNRVLNESARSPVRPRLRRSGSTRSIFAGALDIFTRRSIASTAYETQDDEERGIGLEHEDDEPISRFRLRQMPSILSLSSMIRGASYSKASVPITPSPTATSFLSNNTTTDNLPALISPTESTFSTDSRSTIDSVVSIVSAASAPVDLPFSPSFVRGHDEWDTSIGDQSTTTIDCLQGSYTPVCYEGVFGNSVKKESANGLGGPQLAERESFLSVL